MKTKLFYAFIVLEILTILVPAVGFCEASKVIDVPVDKQRPKIGLVLAGGGALGFAHVGVLKVLEENRIPIDYVAGTSMGSIVGAAYASGMPLGEMEKVLSGMDWDDLFVDNPKRPDLPYRLKSGRDREITGDVKIGIRDGSVVMPSGFIEGQKILPLFQKLFDRGAAPVQFNDLPIPFRAVAADIETGEPVILSNGEVARAVRASMSIPGVFAPVEIDNRLLVDGGIAKNLPIDVVRGMGADVLIIVDLYVPFKKRDELNSLLAISGQMISLLFAQNAAEQKKLIQPQDVFIEPNLTGYTPADFKKGMEMLKIGEEAARKMVDTFKKLSVSKDEYLAFQEKREHSPQLEDVIEFVRVETQSKLFDQVVQESLTIKEGDVLDREKLSHDMKTIYNNGYFNKVYYKYVEENGKKGVVIYGDEKPWFENYVKAGMAMEDDFKGNSTYVLALSHRWNKLNAFGGSLQTDAEIGTSPYIKTELFQPVYPGSRFFFAPDFQFNRKKILIRSEDDIVAEYRDQRTVGDFKLGAVLGSYGEVRTGYTVGREKFDRRIGDPELQDRSFDVGEVFTTFIFDTRNAPDFPASGYNVNISFKNSGEDLGATSDFDQIYGNVGIPISDGQDTLIIGTNFGTNLNGSGVEQLYALGGFLNLSGFAKSSVLASDYVTGSLLFFRRVAGKASGLFEMGAYVGGSLEVSTIQNDLDDLEEYPCLVSGSVFVGADTPLLPVYIGIGYNDEGEVSGYFNLGRLISNRAK